MDIEKIKTGELYWMQGMASETNKPEQVVVKRVNTLANIIELERVETEGFWDCRPEYLCNTLEEAEEADRKCREKEKAIAEADSCWMFLCSDNHDRFEVREAHLIGKMYFPVNSGRKREWFGRLFSAKRFYDIPQEHLFLSEEEAVSYAEAYQRKKAQQYRELADAIEKQHITRISEG